MYSISVPYIDSQHKKLLAIVNNFHESFRAGGPHETISRALNSLVQYAEDHFRDEKAIMEMPEYPPEDMDDHKKSARSLFRMFSAYAKRRKDQVRRPCMVLRCFWKTCL